MLQSNHCGLSGITSPNPSKDVKTPDQSGNSNRNKAIEAKIKIEWEEREKEEKEKEKERQDVELRSAEPKKALHDLMKNKKKER